MNSLSRLARPFGALKRFAAGAALAVFAVLAGAPANDARAQSAISCTCSGPVSIPDTVLRGKVATALGLSPAPATFTCAQMQSLRQTHPTVPGRIDLTGPSRTADNSGRITNLEGLQYATGVTQLLLYRNAITDIRPLQCLTSLTRMWLYDNRIADISPVSSLSNLQWIYADGNRITSVAALQSLTSLVLVSLSRNTISDVSPLSGLTNLIDLSIDYNRVVDVSPLRNLVNLGYTNLNGNRIENIEPLTRNAGFASGNRIFLNNNPLNSDAPTHIATLSVRFEMN